jgi:hypothetical protein
MVAFRTANVVHSENEGYRSRVMPAMAEATAKYLVKVLKAKATSDRLHLVKTPLRAYEATHLQTGSAMALQ